MSVKGTVLITGASRGIGKAFAQAYHDNGWKVLVTARKPEEAASQLSFLSKESIFELDVASDESISHLKSKMSGIKVDLLINNAGIYLRDHGKMDELDAENLMIQYRVNAVGPLLVAKVLTENLMQADKLTKIVNISSIMGSIDDNTSGGSFGYRASKAALNCLSKSLAINLKNEKKNIAVMAIHPGYIKTDMTHLQGEMSPEEAVQKMMLQIEGLTMESSGCFMHRDGFSLPY
jgi:NAD(P)-dependent dehydrogenase (short-subunit alcohol dehydrogenase family)